MSSSKPTWSSLAYQSLFETLGVFLIVFLGTAAVGAMTWTGATFGQWEISIAWGVAVGVAVCVTAPFSGAHLNPAVTLALWAMRRTSTRSVLPFIAAQMLGGVAGAMASYAIYRPLILRFLSDHALRFDTPAILPVAGVFTTFAHAGLTIFDAFLVEMVITAILMLVILVCASEDRAAKQFMPMPLVVGLLVAVIGAATGPLTGFALNPARDFGPRVWLLLMDWGPIVMTGGHAIAYAWVPVCAPVVGALMGAGIYQLTIGRHVTC